MSWWGQTKDVYTQVPSALYLVKVVGTEHIVSTL